LPEYWTVIVSKLGHEPRYLRMAGIRPKLAGPHNSGAYRVRKAGILESEACPNGLRVKRKPTAERRPPAVVIGHGQSYAGGRSSGTASEPNRRKLLVARVLGGYEKSNIIVGRRRRTAVADGTAGQRLHVSYADQRTPLVGEPGRA